MKTRARILDWDEYISHLSKDAAVYSNEHRALKQSWTRIRTMAEKIAHAIPDIGTFSRKKRLYAYQVIDRKLDELVNKNIISRYDRGHILLLLSYSYPDFRKAFKAHTASIGDEIDAMLDSSGNTNNQFEQEHGNPIKDPGERVWFNKKYIYRMHVVVRLFFAAIFTFMILEENRLTHLAPSGDIFWPVFSVAFFIVIPILVLSPYRNSYIEIRENDLILPSLYIPPFKKHKIKYSDVLATERKSNRNGRKLRIKTHSGKYTVSEIHFDGYEFGDFQFELEERVRSLSSG